MQTRQLGPFEVSAVSLGCMSISQGYGSRDPEESERALHRALEVGYSMLDTASAYGAGHNETFIGTVLKGRRHEYVLASKCGLISAEDGRRYIDGKPDTIKQTCDASLQRLQTDHIDLYYLHRRDPDVPIEDSVGALSDLVQAGKIREVGLSEASEQTLRRAHATHPIAALQSEYSLWTRDPEFSLLNVCAELGIAFVAFAPLARAYLTGTLDDVGAFTDTDLRRSMPRFMGDNWQHNLSLLEEYASIARDNGCTMAQLAIAWVLAQGDNIIPIPGTKKVAYVEENAGAAELTIAAADLTRAGEIINRHTVRGLRYGNFKTIGVETDTWPELLP